MSTPILATKLFIPSPSPRAVLRPRLLERLNEGLARAGGITLISAPAGSGKSTLVSEWVATLNPSASGRGAGVRVSWLSLDEADNDLPRFLLYLISALQKIESGVGAGALSLLQAPQQPSVETILTVLINALAAVPSTSLLVLDDVHVLDSKPVENALAYLIEHLPPHVHLTLATREDPPLPLARLRARGRLTELRAADLRFTLSESATFLNQRMGLRLTPEETAALEARTEGWIAGLQLAALSMLGHHDTASFIKSFTGSHHFVLDYLVEEVLGQQPESLQTFLLHTSILDRMCASLCDAVLRDSAIPAQATLERLEHTNLFIVPLDSERRWYRYHHLFGDLLRQRLGKNRSLTEITELHGRASQWYEQNGPMLDAFHHALAAGDFERAARLAETAWQGMERNFHTLAWLGWIKKLPDAVICSRPRLCVQMGWAYSDVGELESSETCLQNAERALVGMKEQDEFKSIPGNIALIRAGNAQIEGDLAKAVQYAELAIQLAPENDSLIRAQAAITLGFTRWAVGNVESSLQAMRTWMEDMQRLGNQMYVLASAFVVADMQVILGRLGEAEKALRQTIDQAATYGPEAENVTAHHQLGLAMLAHERGDEAALAQHLQTVAELGQRSTLIDWAYRWGLAQARLKESAGAWADTLRFLDEAQRGYVKNPIPMLQPVEARKARIYLKQGRLDQAQAWARERDLSVGDEANYMDEYEHLTLARIRLAEGSFEGVGQLLERQLALAETQKRTGSVIEILLTQALVHQAQGEAPQALAALGRALALTEPEGYLRIFTDEGEPMRTLLEKHLSHRDFPSIGYVERILAAWPKLLAATPQSKIENRTSEVVEPLSERELEVLQLLRSELSGPEIAQHLTVSLNTLRTHTKNIFNKLDVNNRRAAIRRAEELGLF